MTSIRTQCLAIFVSILAVAVAVLTAYNSRHLPTIIIERTVMDYKEAAAFIMPIGQYTGQSLDKIAETIQGLLYLDWMRGQRERERSKQIEFFDNAKHVADPLLDALAAYLDDPTIAKDLAEAVTLPKDAGSLGR